MIDGVTITSRRQLDDETLLSSWSFTEFDSGNVILTSRVGASEHSHPFRCFAMGRVPAFRGAMSSAARAARRRAARDAAPYGGWRRDHEWQRSMDGLPWADGEEPPVCWRKGLLGALVSRDRLGHSDYRWHISVQHRDRVPTWEEIAASGHELRPGVVFVLGVPPRSWWINVHPHVLHLWELRDEALIEQWRFERRGDEPT